MNVTKGNVAPLKATLSRDGDSFPVADATDVCVAMVSAYGARTVVAETAWRVDAELDGVVWVDAPATLGCGCYGLEVSGALNGKKWRTFTGDVLKVTQGTESGGEGAAVSGDAYDVAMEVQLYTYISPDAIKRHDADGDAHSGVQAALRAYADDAVAALRARLDALIGVGDVTSTIDTFNEVKAFLEGIKDTTLQDILATIAGNITAAVADKVDKVAGKGLSANDYTDAEKALVASALQSESDPVFSASAAAGIKGTDIAAWNGKQDAIADLATIRSGASAGATAYQKPATGIPATDLAAAVQTSLWLADTALQAHQDISGKEDRTAVVAASGTTLAASTGHYYRFDSEVGTLAVTLSHDTTGNAQSAILFLATGASPALTFAPAVSGEAIHYSETYLIESLAAYEVNALWNGQAWVVMATAVEIEEEESE